MLYFYLVKEVRSHRGWLLKRSKTILCISKIHIFMPRFGMHVVVDDFYERMQDALINMHMIFDRQTYESAYIKI
jgi:hypothetical protein